MTYKMILSVSNNDIEIVHVELKSQKHKNIIIGTTYRPPIVNVHKFEEQLKIVSNKIITENKEYFYWGILI